MTPFEDCCMIAYHCDGSGNVLVDADGDDEVFDVDLQNPYDFIAGQLGITDLQLPEDTDVLMCPEDWPLHDYPFCICEESVLGGHHFVVQWGNAHDDIEDEDWAEWQLALHPECLSTFFEYIRGAEDFGVWDREEWFIHRDKPPSYMYDERLFGKE